MKLYLITALLFLTCSSVSAQYIDGSNTEESHSKFTDRLFFGGILGMQFGSEYTNIEVAPLIGYKVTERFSTGLNLKYIYLKVHPDQNSDYTTHVYGGGPFARFFVYEGLFLHTEYEVLNMDVADFYGHFSRQNVTSVFVGGGYRQMIGEHSAMDLMILFNINESTNSPYRNPIIHFGFAFGI